ncbi:hypothetical protein AGMMS49942_19660 [Spirochaetia bacterium]|nr:hypothetical protein AGMMS49942_19660 [Spirochaetia bacterium]
MYLAVYLGNAAGEKPRTWVKDLYQPFEIERVNPGARRFSREGVVKRRGSPGAGSDLHVPSGKVLRKLLLVPGGAAGGPGAYFLLCFAEVPEDPHIYKSNVYFDSPGMRFSTAL